MALFDLQDPAALRIREAATRGTLSHALLLTGSGQRVELARYAAAALECEAEGNRPCGICRACRKVEENITQASSGNKVFGIKLSADYVLSQKINLQLFYDHQGTTPLISSSYPVKADNVGITIKLMLTR